MRYALYAALFATPLFFLPVTLYAVSLNKQLLFSTLMLGVALVWLGQALLRGKILYVKNPMNAAVLALFAASLISAAFSYTRRVGLLGVNGGEVDAVIAAASFLALYFIGAMVLREDRAFRGTVAALCASGIVLLLFEALQIMGVHLFPWEFARDINFNPVGTTNALGVVFGFFSVLAFSAAHQGIFSSKACRVWLWIFAAASAALAAYIGYAPIFIAAAAAMLCLVFFGVRGKNILAPLGGMIAALFIALVITGIVSITVPRLEAPAEVTPSIAASVRIAVSAAREGVKEFLVGSGPGTYQYLYAKHRDPALNQSYFWDIRFAQGFNAFFTHAVVGGIASVLAVLILLALAAREIARLMVKKRASGQGAVAAAAASYLILSLFLYPQNFTLYVLLYAALSMLAVEGVAEHGEGVISLSDSPQRNIFGSLAVMLIMLGGGLMLYMSAERYWGARSFERAVAVAAEGSASLEKALPLFIAAQSHDKQNDLYLQTISSVVLARANALASGSAPFTQETQNQISAAIAMAVSAAEEATRANPLNAASWVNLARVYEAVMPIVEGAAPAAFKAYEEARLREPSNPAIPAGLARAHIAFAERLKKEARAAEYVVAEAALEESLRLKPDYEPALALKKSLKEK